MRALRLCFVLLASTLLPSCLVDDPPTYSAPQKTKPRLEYSNATPLLDQLIIAGVGELIEFNVPVTSEDVGDPLYGSLLLDYPGVGGVARYTLLSLPLRASTLDDADRAVSIPWTVPEFVKPGCHRFTMIVTHFSNVVGAGDLLDQKDAAEVYWFANLNVSAQNANSLVECPQASRRSTGQ